MWYRRSVTLDAYSNTHIGLVRASQQDAFVSDPYDGVFLVADGVGGQPHGADASSVAASSAVTQLAMPGDGESRTRAAFSWANRDVFDATERRPALRGMASTLVTARIAGRTAWIGNLGDSRAYLLRGTAFVQLTRDHGHAGFLTAAIGFVPQTPPDIESVELRPGDVLLLCSDGLTNAIDDRAIAGVLARSRTAHAAVDRLIAAALAGGGPDNVTVIVVRVVS